MWPVAILLMGVVLFYNIAFWGIIWAWLQTIICLCKLQFVRASVWFSIGCGGLWWWTGTEGVDFDKWLQASYMFVALGATATLLRYLNRIIPPRLPPFEPSPVVEPAPVVLNININIDPRADPSAVHDSLAALASALRSAISTGQGPRQIPGPTVIN